MAPEQEPSAVTGFAFMDKLAEGVRQNPYVAGAALVVAILAAAVVQLQAKDAVLTLAFVAVFGIGAIVVLARIGQRAQRPVRTTPSVTAANTWALATLVGSEDRTAILGALKGAATEMAAYLRLDPNLVRANLFGLDDRNLLRILPGLYHNMNREVELTLEIPRRQGSTGLCFDGKSLNTAEFKDNWGDAQLGDAEMKKVHPELRWIMSVPVFDANAHPIWVLNVDGLKERRTEEELVAVSPRMFHWAELISRLLPAQEGRIV